MAGRPRLWYPFTQTPWALGFEWTETGRVRDRSRHELPDRHRVFWQHTRAETLAREWLGRPPRMDCAYCGTRRRVGDRYAGRPRGGGPAYMVTFLNGDHRDCSRANLKYAPDDEQLRVHESLHITSLMRGPITSTAPFNLPRATFHYDPGPRPRILKGKL